MDVYAGATLTTSAWNGEVGAVLAFRATGTVWVEEGGSISVSAKGYAGGDTGTNQDDDGYQGESVGGEGIGGTLFDFRFLQRIHCGVSPRTTVAAAAT